MATLPNILDQDANTVKVEGPNGQPLQMTNQAFQSTYGQPVPPQPQASAPIAGPAMDAAAPAPSPTPASSDAYKMFSGAGTPPPAEQPKDPNAPPGVADSIGGKIAGAMIDPVGTLGKLGVKAAQTEAPYIAPVVNKLYNTHFGEDKASPEELANAKAGAELAAHPVGTPTSDAAPKAANDKTEQPPPKAKTVATPHEVASIHAAVADPANIDPSTKQVDLERYKQSLKLAGVSDSVAEISTQNLKKHQDLVNSIDQDIKDAQKEKADAEGHEFKNAPWYEKLGRGLLAVITLGGSEVQFNRMIGEAKQEARNNVMNNKEFQEKLLSNNIPAQAMSTAATVAGNQHVVATITDQIDNLDNQIAKLTNPALKSQKMQQRSILVGQRDGLETENKTYLDKLALDKQDANSKSKQAQASLNSSYASMKDANTKEYEAKKKVDLSRLVRQDGEPLGFADSKEQAQELQKRTNILASVKPLVQYFDNYGYSDKLTPEDRQDAQSKASMLQNAIAQWNEGKSAQETSRMNDLITKVMPNPLTATPAQLRAGAHAFYGAAALGLGTEMNNAGVTKKKK